MPLEQDFVKDGSLTVGKVLANDGSSVKKFVRFEMGEGLEKKVDNYLDEIGDAVSKVTK